MFDRVNARLGHVLLAAKLGGALVGFEQGHVVPALDGEDFHARLVVGALQPGEGFRDAGLRGLVLHGDGNAVAVVPDRHQQRDLEYPGGVHRFEEHALRRRRIADGGEADFVAVVGERGQVTQIGVIPVQF